MDIISLSIHIGANIYNNLIDGKKSGEVNSKDSKKERVEKLVNEIIKKEVEGKNYKRPKLFVNDSLTERGEIVYEGIGEEEFWGDDFDYSKMWAFEYRCLNCLNKCNHASKCKVHEENIDDIIKYIEKERIDLDKISTNSGLPNTCCKCGHESVLHAVDCLSCEKATVFVFEEIYGQPNFDEDAYCVNCRSICDFEIIKDDLRLRNS